MPGAAPRIAAAVQSIKEELEQRLEQLRSTGKLLEAQRLNARTRFDIEMMQEVGYCPGIENYSRPLSGRPPGSTPDTLFNYFPTKESLVFHQDRAREAAMIEAVRERVEGTPVLTAFQA